MEKRMDIKEIARRAYSPLRNDGVEDLLAGVILFNFGALLNAQSIMPYGVVFLPFIAWFARWFVTYPRVGYIKPAKRQPSARWALAAEIISAFTAIALLALLLIWKHYPGSPFVRTWPVNLMHLVMVVMLIVLLISLGIDSGMRRWYAYAALAAAFAVLAGFMRGWMPVDGIAAFGVLVTIWGLVIMANFVRNNPVREKEVADDPAIGATK